MLRGIVSPRCDSIDNSKIRSFISFSARPSLVVAYCILAVAREAEAQVSGTSPSEFATRLKEGSFENGRSRKSETRTGDWIVEGTQTVREKNIRLEGSLILPADASLTLEDCTLNISGEYSRQHSVEFQGGTLITKNCEIGGIVNDSGMAIHTVFHLYEGLWEATDTVVSYSYGISFHWEKGKGVLRGNRLRAGPRPDAIILSGEADVELVDSNFPLGIGLYCNEGGSTSLDLTPVKSATKTFDRDNLLPGVNWRLKLQNTDVERWFLFVRRIGGWQKPVSIKLNGSKDLIVSLFPHNLTGEVTLTNQLDKPLQIANVTIQNADDQPAGISMYAMYFSGEDTNALINGRTHLCEWMEQGGRVKVHSTVPSEPISMGCTTMELAGQSELDLKNVHLGRPLNWHEEDNLGEANLTDSARLVGNQITTKNLRFRTEKQATVEIDGVTSFGKLERSGDGIKIMNRHHQTKK